MCCSHTDYNKRMESELTDRCKGIHAMLENNLLAYTSQPIPFLGKVDLAAVFLARQKFASENILFGKCRMLSLLMYIFLSFRLHTLSFAFVFNDRLLFLNFTFHQEILQIH